MWSIKPTFLGFLRATIDRVPVGSLLVSKLDEKREISKELPVGSTDIAPYIKPLLNQFDDNLGYTRPKLSGEFDRLARGMKDQVSQLGVLSQGSLSHVAFKLGLFYAYLAFPHHPLEVRIYIGFFIWLGLLVDDHESGATKHPDEWQHFTHRFHNGSRHSAPLAQAWANHLRLTYQYFCPMAANIIVISALSFTNFAVVEGSDLKKMTRTTGGRSWSHFLRDKDGIGEAFACFTFPKPAYNDITDYLEAIPDMNMFLSCGNDILSFYKEELAGETENYVRNRVFYEEKDVSEVLHAVIEENVDRHRRIQVVLQDKQSCARAWLEHVMGYLAMHKTIERYRLKELGLGEEFPDEVRQLTNLYQGT